MNANVLLLVAEGDFVFFSQLTFLTLMRAETHDLPMERFKRMTGWLNESLFFYI